MPHGNEPKKTRHVPDLIAALCTAVAVLAACGLLWVTLTWEPLH